MRMTLHSFDLHSYRVASKGLRRTRHHHVKIPTEGGVVFCEKCLMLSIAYG